MRLAYFFLAPSVLVTVVTAVLSFGHNGPWDRRLKLLGHKKPPYDMPYMGEPDLPSDAYKMYDDVTHRQWHEIRKVYAFERSIELWEIYDENPTNPPSEQRVLQSRRKLSRWLEGEVQVLQRRAAIKREIAAERAKLDQLEEEGRGDPATAKERSRRANVIRARLKQLEEDYRTTIHPRRARADRRQRWNDAGWRPFDWGVVTPSKQKKEKQEEQASNEQGYGDGEDNKALPRQSNGKGDSMADQAGSLARKAKGYFQSVVNSAEDAAKEMPGLARDFWKPPSSAGTGAVKGRFVPKGRP